MGAFTEKGWTMKKLKKSKKALPLLVAYRLLKIGTLVLVFKETPIIWIPTLFTTIMLTILTVQNKYG